MVAGEIKVLCDALVKRAEKLAAENAELRAAYTKVDRQLCDALDGIAELKMKVKGLEQINEELRGLPIPRRSA